MYLSILFGLLVPVLVYLCVVAINDRASIRTTITARDFSMNYITSISHGDSSVVSRHVSIFVVEQSLIGNGNKNLTMIIFLLASLC